MAFIVNKLIFISIIAILFVQCGTETNQSFTVNTLVVPTEGGTITIFPEKNAFQAGDEISITAVPDTGYIFHDWTNDSTLSKNPLNIRVTDDINLVAEFRLKSYPLTVTVEGQGEVFERVLPKKSTEYEHSTHIELRPNAKTGWEFKEWKGDIASTDSVLILEITEEINITAVFELKSYPLTVTIIGSGEVTDSIVVEKAKDFEHGTKVSLSAKANKNWIFLEWSGDISDTTSSIVITVNEPVEVIATFQQFWLMENGITIDCANASIGDKGFIKGVQYTKRTASQITSENASLSCTSGITDMSELFQDKASFNGDISHWDVSSVSSMENMFFGAIEFNTDISVWDVSNLTNMAGIFANTKFNMDLSEWLLTSVINMSGTFENSQFNQDISNWDVSNVVLMENMFGNSDFNKDISNWDVSNVIDMSNMFKGAAFNQNIISWNVQSVTNMESMFDSSLFNQDLSAWQVINVKNMVSMFANSVFNKTISSWRVSNVTSMKDMFKNSEFNQSISTWDVSNVINMEGMFENSSFNQPINNWNISNVTNIKNMFKSTLFNQNIGG